MGTSWIRLVLARSTSHWIWGIWQPGWHLKLFVTFWEQCPASMGAAIRVCCCHEGWAWSAAVFGCTVHVKQNPHKHQDPRFPSKAFYYNEMMDFTCQRFWCCGWALALINVSFWNMLKNVSSLQHSTQNSNAIKDSLWMQSFQHSFNHCSSQRRKSTPCSCDAPVGDLSFPKVLHACSSSGGLSGFIHQAPAVRIAVPVTCDRGTRWGNGQRQSTHQPDSQPTASCL